MKQFGRCFLFLLTLPAYLIQLIKSISIYVSTRRWYLLGFIPCSAGLWPLGLYLWERPAQRWYIKVSLRMLSYVCFLFGTALFFEGLWIFSGLLLLIRFIMWIDAEFELGRRLPSSDESHVYPPFRHPLDVVCVVVIFLMFLIFAINKDRLLETQDPSDHYYHMAVAQKILERGEIPMWDDWEFAPMGRPHLYPPFLHLLIAYFAGEPEYIEQGFTSIQMLLYPAALFSYWYLFRVLLGPAWAYLSLLVLSMEFMFGMGCLLGLPASLVNVIWPWIIIALLNKRTYIAMVLLALCFYTHTGMPLLISLALFVLGIWKREYFWQVLAVLAGAFVLSLPWTMRYLAFADWMHSGGAKGYNVESIMARLLWLQIVNPLFIVLACWGWFTAREKNVAVFRSQVIGFLPMLTQYGGRFFMHGAPFLAPLIARPFLRFVEGNITRRRAVAIWLLTLIPLPCVNFMGANDTIKPQLFPNITASHYSLFISIHREHKEQKDLQQVTNMIKATTSPDDIIHLPDSAPHFADLIVVKTGRATDMGGWGEVSKPEMWEAVMKSRADPKSGIFLVNDSKHIPEGYTIKKVGKYYLGLP